MAFNRGSSSTLIGAVVALDDENVLIAGNGDGYQAGIGAGPAIPFTNFYTADENSLDTYGVFIAKMNTVTNSIEFLTHIVTSDGAGSNSSVFDMDVDEFGNIYMVGIVGRTIPPGGDLLPPADRLEGHFGEYKLEDDGLFIKLDSSGNLLVASYFGGTGTEVPYKVKALGQNRFSIAGSTSSTDFPLRNSLVPAMRGENDGFLQIYESDNTLSFSTLIGGEFDDRATALAYSNDRLIVGGRTNSPDFPVTGAALSPALLGGYDGWLLELDTTSNAQTYGSYYGSQNYNDIQSIEFLGDELVIAGTSVIDSYFANPDPGVGEVGVYFKRLDSSLMQTQTEGFYNGQSGSTIYANYLSVTDSRVAIVGGVSGANPLYFPVRNRLTELNDSVQLYGHHGGGVSENGSFAVVWDSTSDVVSATQLTDTGALGGTAFASDFLSDDSLLIGGASNSIAYIDQTYSLITNPGGAVSGEYAMLIDLSGPRNEPPIARNDSVTVPVNAVDHQFSPLANDIDPDGDIDLGINGSFYWISGPNNGGVYDDADGNMFYTPNADFTGNDIIDYEIRDAAGEIAYARITLRVQAPPTGGGGGSSSTSNSGGGGGSILWMALILMLASLRRHSRVSVAPIHPIG